MKNLSCLCFLLFYGSLSFSQEYFPVKIIFTQPQISNYHNLFYNIKVINTTNRTLKYIRLKIYIPKGMRFIGSKSNFRSHLNKDPKNRTFVCYKIGEMKAYKELNIRIRMEYNILTLENNNINNNIQIKCIAPRRAYLNRTIDYNYVIENRGKKEAKNLILKSLLPNNMIYLSSTLKGKCQIRIHKPIVFVTIGKKEQSAKYLPKEGKKLTILIWKIEKLLPYSKQVIQTKCKVVKCGVSKNLAILQINNKIICQRTNRTIVYTASLDLSASVSSYIKNDEVEYNIAFTSPFKPITNVIIEHYITTNNLSLTRVKSSIDYKLIKNKLIFTCSKLHRGEALHIAITYKNISKNGIKSHTIFSWDQSDEEIAIERIWYNK